jgi:hypothetical protein
MRIFTLPVTIPPTSPQIGPAVFRIILLLVPGPLFLFPSLQRSPRMILFLLHLLLPRCFPWTTPSSALLLILLTPLWSYLVMIALSPLLPLRTKLCTPPVTVTRIFPVAWANISDGLIPLPLSVQNANIPTISLRPFLHLSLWLFLTHRRLFLVPNLYVGSVGSSSLVPRVSRPPPTFPAPVPAQRPRVPVSKRWFYETAPSSPPVNDSRLSPDVLDEAAMEDRAWQRTNPHWNTSHDKYEAAVLAVDPLLVVPALTFDVISFLGGSSSSSNATPGPDMTDDLRREVARFVKTLSLPLKPRQPWMLDGDSRSDAEADDDWRRTTMRLLGPPVDTVPVCPVDAPSTRPVTVTPMMLSTLLEETSSSPFVPTDLSHAYISPASSTVSFPPTSAPHLNSKVIRRILAARESIFKYGIYLPRNDRDADISPERLRWNSGRQLEWLRLKKVQAFEYDWDKARLARDYPNYLLSDIGKLFYIYDYKFSGEHRVRLVFDGSQQGVNTYDETYSPTVRPESIRMFHVYAVEMGWAIRQYDVPQAFLQAKVDHDIFAYPPRTNIEFPGQLLKLRLALYGAKQSSALFFKLLNAFLLSLGFVSSSMDRCFYRQHDALLIVHVDDMRCAGTSEALQSIHAALLDHFKITTGDGTRFHGMDTSYDLAAGVLTMGMSTYIQATIDRFLHFDLWLGVPYREIVGCLLWIVLCVVGPELVRVKDLARRSNSPTLSDYNDAIKVLTRIFKRRHTSIIIFKRGFAGRELIPSMTRPESSLLRMTPTRARESKDSISGYVIYVNGTPVMWGSMRQTTVADSTCAAEFVAASVCCKQLLHLENIFHFLGFLCPKPYKIYTDSQASQSIAMNNQKMGKIRHIAIRYHLVRGLAGNGDVVLIFCVTEDMVADLFTKILSGSPFVHLATRFYFCGI